MKLASLDSVNALVRERDRLIETHAAIDLDQVHVVVRGAHQDDALVALIRPVMMRELSARRLRLEAELKSLGVELR